MKRKGILIVLILIFVTFFLYNYLNKEHRDIANEKVTVTLKAIDFYELFQENQDKFNEKYLDKVVQLKGIISSLEETGLILDDKGYITFKDTMPRTLKTHTQITVKGRYVGYDDLLEQHKIDQAIIIND